MTERKRLGLIVPSSNSVMEVDFYRNLPEDITLHVARMYLYDTTVAGEEEMLDVHFPKALSDLATVVPDAVVFGCTSAGALRGNAYDAKLCEKITEVAKCPSISVIASVRKAIEKLKLHKVAVITPYIEALNQRIKASLEADGVEVAAIHGLGIDHNHSIGMVKPEEIFQFTMEKVQGLTVDGVFLSCTNFRAMEVYKELQAKLGLPVITSNQVALEAALEVLGKNNSRL
ncbi:maleate cis-trans isomerase family protein [Zhaonella formicivorans]|jgi:maleate isomerase|uniref:maleate cis-trans isomerase family protein n=1 Tax=Zhaonella formicivorans TaxID=2528593 RepID=UPI0010EEBBA7|nr:aspartate/glutamate racemase family protein [Zhaonella formicivorans]